MARARLSFRLHRTAIVLICVTLLVLLMQGASWFSLSHQMARSAQVDDLADTLIRQLSSQLEPLMAQSDDNTAPIQAILDKLTVGSRILDASVYAMDGSLIARSGENISVRDRLAIERQRAGSFFNHQLVRTMTDKDGPCGFVRLTLDTHVLETEAKQVDNTTNLLRLMILLALAIGIILARTLLQNRRSRWQQSPYLLTASTPLAERKDEDEEDDGQAPPKT
ncbi:YtjB family periplasmic protein [Acerihabitans sp. TG2]|uniref:YtjB family periplasmic protein n=1 Tax=Acerihabitans sp. TG2 TaxID=3096008 RepID=UPI002B235EF1|nr:YtjB family periplasmic protein [Acerihabitans sp. TG2]MEA9392903.1 YtjB family periplasmic protein [Acerihabitans sp. TG2]